MPAGDYRYNHSKESSPDSPEVGITREEAIVRTNKDYLALYRPIGQGIAEWVYTKEPKDETPNPISVAAVDWDEVAKGNQKAPQLLDLRDEGHHGFNWLTGGEWVYVLRAMGSDHLRCNWGSSDEAAQGGRPLKEAIHQTNKEYLALYQYLGDGIAEWVYTPEQSILVDAVDWDEVDKGDQEAPRLLNLNIQDPPQRLATLKANEWIYVGVGTEDTAGIYHTGWDPSGSVSLKQALSRIKKGVPFYLGFSDIYRYVGEGIAEWVCSKHDEDKEKYSVAMDSVDWDAVEAGQQEAPARIHMHKAKGVWIYVGPPQADGSQWCWNLSSQQSEQEAIADMEKDPLYVALYQCQGNGTAEWVRTKNQTK